MLHQDVVQGFMADKPVVMTYEIGAYPAQLAQTVEMGGVAILHCAAGKQDWRKLVVLAA